MTARCDDVVDLLPEFALGALGGDERAQVLDHVRTCPACRAEVDGLTAAVDRTVDALAGAEPLAGLEQRVLERIDAVPDRPAPPSPPPPPPSRLPVVVAIAAVLLLVVGSVVAVALTAGDGSGRRQVAVRTAPMRTPDGWEVGTAALTDRPPAVLVDAPAWDGGHDGDYSMRVTTRDGTVHATGPIDLDDGRGAYALPGIEASAVARVEMLDADGAVACTATFT